MYVFLAACVTLFVSPLSIVPSCAPHPLPAGVLRRGQGDERPRSRRAAETMRVLHPDLPCGLAWDRAPGRRPPTSVPLDSNWDEEIGPGDVFLAH